MTDPTLEELGRLLAAPFDGVLADVSRLRVLAALAGVPDGGRLSFTALRKLLGMTDGNLGGHVGVLAEVGYVDVEKVMHGRRPQSLYAATAAGRAALTRHLESLSALIAATSR